MSLYDPDEDSNLNEYWLLIQLSNFIVDEAFHNSVNRDYIREVCYSNKLSD
jgi:hypothetical protein